MPYQFILVLFRRSRRTRHSLQRCRNSLWALFWVRLRTPYCLNASLDNDFEDIPLTEPDDDIRPEPDGDGEDGNLPSDEELEAMFGEDDEIEADAVFDAGA